MKYNKSKKNKLKKLRSKKYQKNIKNKTHKRKYYYKRGKTFRKGGFGWLGPAIATTALLSQNTTPYNSQQRGITKSNPATWTPAVSSSGLRGPPRLPPNKVPRVAFSENNENRENLEGSKDVWKTYEELTPQEQDREFHENATGMAGVDNPFSKFLTFEDKREKANALREAMGRYTISPYTLANAN